MPLHISVIGLAALWSIPTIALLVSSFRDPGLVVTSGWWNAITSPLDFTLDNYETVLDRQRMARSFLNSLIITIPSTLLVILVAALAAYAFAWMQFPFRNALFLVVVALLVVPLQMTLIPVLRLYVNLNDWLPFLDTEIPLLGGRLFGTNSYPGIWVAHAAYGLPFAVYLLRNFFGVVAARPVRVGVPRRRIRRHASSRASCCRFRCRPSRRSRSSSSSGSGTTCWSR